jgi:L-asparagine oxygenase
MTWARDDAPCSSGTRSIPTDLSTIVSVSTVRSHLNTSGFHYQPNVHPAALLHLATELGTPTPDHRDTESIRFIRPQVADSARPNTLSSRYGMGSFPFHTDAAYWPVPPRFLFLHCANPGSGYRPTLLVDSLAFNLTGSDQDHLSNDVWRIKTKKPFLCTVATHTPHGLRLRYDEACMMPATRRAVRVQEILQRCIHQAHPTSINWQPSDLLILDNARMLHARGSARHPDPDRCLARILIAE